MTGAEALARALVDRGIRRVFSHAGGTISRLLDAADREGIRVVVATQESQAVHMAQGAYRVTGRPQVAFVTSGPGVTNAVTGIADAYYDQDAVVLICGQVATTSRRGGRPIRQLGFQETPTVEIMRPICKAAVLVDFAPDLGPTVRDALELAVQPRPGPVVLDVPMDVQIAEAGNQDGGYSRLQFRHRPGWRVSMAEAEDLLAALRRASWPVVVAGRGCLTATRQLRQFSERFGLSVVTSLAGVGAMPSKHPNYDGILGHTGHKIANEVVAGADFILALGTRLDVRQTGSDNDWRRGKTVATVDYSHEELNFGRIRPDFFVCFPVKGWLEWANAHA